MCDPCLCLDVGSTNIKYALFENGNRTDCGKCPFPAPTRSDNVFFEVSADAVFDSVKKIIDGYPSAKNVFFSVQMHGHILSSEPTKYVSWRDERSLCGQVFERYRNFIGKEITSLSGTSSKPNLSVYSLLYEYENGKAPVGELFSLGSYIVYRLTGNNISHVTDLCALGFYLKNGEVNQKLLSVLPFGIRLPVCVSKVQECGEYRGIKIFTPVGDQQSSVFALQEESDSILNIGTAAQICRIVAGDVYGNFESRPYFYNKTLCTVTGLIGGAILRENKDFGALKEKMSAQFRTALQNLHSKKRILCTGGAFSFYKEFIFEILYGLGYLPFYKNSDALEGLQLLSRRLK